MKAMVVTPSLVLREREASPLKAQMPRNSATELSTTSFFLFILAHKGDIIGVKVQLKQSKHFHFHLNYENGKEKRGPLTTFDSIELYNGRHAESEKSGVGGVSVIGRDGY